MDCSRCNVSWVLGTAGECDSDGICVCPTGYDGNDDWQSFNDCHIDNNFRVFVRVVTLSLSLICLLVGLYAVISILRKEEHIDSMNRSMTNFRSFSPISLPPKGKLIATTTSLRTPVHGFDGNVGRPRLQEAARNRSAAREEGRAARHQQHTNTTITSTRSVAHSRYVNLTIRRAYYLLSLFIAFGLSGVVYQIYFFLPQPILRSQGNLLQDFCVAVAVSCLFVGLWSFTLMWYSSLPSIEVYGRLFGLNHILLRYPNLLGYVASFHIGASMVLFMTFFFILPASISGNEDVDDERRMVLRNSWDRLALIVMLVNVTDWIFTMQIVSFLLRKVYLRSLITLRTQTDRVVYESFFRAADKTGSPSRESDVGPMMHEIDVNEASLASNGSKSGIKSFLSRVKSSFTGKNSSQATIDSESKYETARGHGRREDMLEVFERASSVVRQILLFTWIGGVSGGLVILGMVTSDYMASNKYLFFNLLAVIGSIGAIQLTYGLVFRALR